MSLFVFLLGLCIGSFLNVVIYRLPAGGSVSRPRSYCPGCGTTLKWYNLIPLASFLVQGGKCASCKAKISPRYFFVELLTGVLFLMIYKYYGISWQALSYWTFTAILIAVSFIDLDHRIIPNRVTAFGAVTGALFALKTGVTPSLAGFVLGGGLLLALAVLSRGNMGGGDVKLAAVMGLFLGWKLLIPALLWGFLLGAVVGVSLIVLGKAGRKSHIPFGPFLAAGSVISLLWGNQIITWYLNYIIGF
ncbi:MAG: prepilin peptidase [Firmicutes bacterium HGW-Firmicutes-14]|nr:MAG: prepilin peptidase [Firmicutes bacterium HGW-Firmicutes-14]